LTMEVREGSLKGLSGLTHHSAHGAATERSSPREIERERDRRRIERDQQGVRERQIDRLHECTKEREN